jgi:bifunctional UDP-N-acetylglucosamine pyrophosphorylase/glucosamine-1-phosphate N-acetyltransferase
MKGLNIVILAAGKGERMKSKKSKVMHEIMGKPMIGHVVERARELAPEVIVVVVGHGRESVEGYLKDRGVSIAVQAEQKGTAHALLATENLLKEGDTLVLYGDVPLMEGSTLRAFLDFCAATGDIVFMVTDVDNPKGYGRVIMEKDMILEIVEDNDATEDQKLIKTINTGICVIPRSSFQLLKEITPSNRKGEYYLTDICTIARQKGKSVRGYRHDRSSEVLGINSRRELLDANTAMKDHVFETLLEQGVTLLDRNIYISPDVAIGRDTIISPNCFISGTTSIGEDVVIGPNSIIKDSMIADGVTIEAFSSVEGIQVEKGARIGPYARLRPETSPPGKG